MFTEHIRIQLEAAGVHRVRAQQLQDGGRQVNTDTFTRQPCTQTRELHYSIVSNHCKKLLNATQSRM